VYIEILPTLRNEKHSADLVKKYFAKDDGRFRYSGAYFEHLGGGAIGRRLPTRSQLKTCLPRAC
jgi:hypothetical protein